jgi:hypothetical protein
MVTFKTGADDTNFGEMICEWDDTAALMTIRRRIEKVYSACREWLEQIGISEWPGEAVIQSEIDTLMVRADALFEEYAPEIFFQAQASLVAAVMLKLSEEAPQNIRDVSGRSLAEIWGKEMWIFKEARKDLSEFFKTRHNETIGVHRGRPAQISLKLFLETLRLLPANARWPRIVADHEEELKRWGWTYAGDSRKGTQWTRPGKDVEEGISATLFPNGILFVFSSNAHPLPQCDQHAITPFSRYALYDHKGDFKAAAKALAKAGYGEPLKKDKPKTEPGPVVAHSRVLDSILENVSSWLTGSQKRPRLAALRSSTLTIWEVAREKKCVFQSSESSGRSERRQPF